MTYCCGILVRDGLVMFADTRTNAGVDNISTFRKLHVLVQPGQRIMAVASAGNLSISQSVVSILREGWDNPETGETVPGGMEGQLMMQQMTPTEGEPKTRMLSQQKILG